MPTQDNKIPDAAIDVAQTEIDEFSNGITLTIGFYVHQYAEQVKAEAVAERDKKIAELSQILYDAENNGFKRGLKENVFQILVGPDLKHYDEMAHQNLMLQLAIKEMREALTFIKGHCHIPFKASCGCDVKLDAALSLQPTSEDGLLREITETLTFYASRWIIERLSIDESENIPTPQLIEDGGERAAKLLTTLNPQNEK